MGGPAILSGGVASSPAPSVAGAAEQVAGTLTCGRSGSMASLGGPSSCRESCAELATTLAPACSSHISKVQPA